MVYSHFTAKRFIVSDFTNMFFREESTLVDVFVLEILVTYIESLALAHLDDQGLGWYGKLNHA